MVMGFTGDIKTEQIIGKYFVKHTGIVDGVWGNHYPCGYEGQFDNNGSRGFHCPRCGMKILNEEHKLNERL